MLFLFCFVKNKKYLNDRCVERLTFVVVVVVVVAVVDDDGGVRSICPNYNNKR